MPNQISSNAKSKRLWYFFWKFSMWTHPSCDCQVRPYDQDKEADEVSNRCLWGTPWGTLFTANAFPLSIVFFVFSMVFSGFSQNHSNYIIDCSNPDQNQNVWYEKGLHIRKSQRAQKKAHSLSIPTKCLLCSCSFLVI